MSRKHLFLGLLLACGVAGALWNAPLQAQPDLNNPPKADNPPNWDWNPGQRGGLRRVPRTPEQLRQLRERRANAQILSIKQQMTRAGFTDEALQTAVADEYKDHDEAQADLVSKWQQITQAVRRPDAPEAEMTTMLKDFREAVAKEKTRRDAATKALEDKFQVSQKPVLDALLMTIGIIGDEASLMGQNSSSAITTYGGGVMLLNR